MFDFECMYVCTWLGLKSVCMCLFDFEWVYVYIWLGVYVGVCETGPSVLLWAGAYAQLCVCVYACIRP